MTLQLGPGRYLGETRDHQVVADLVVTETLHRLPARLPLHTHTAPYYCLVLSGAFDERVGATLCEARSGDLLFHSAGETHTDEIRAEGTQLVSIALGGTWVGVLGQLEPCRRPRPGRQSAAAARVAGRIARELAAHDPISGLAIEGLLHRLLAESDHSPALHGGPPRWLPVALEFIRSHFRSCFDHEALARVAGVHATHLSRAFHAHMGCTVTGYVHRLRIEWARERVERNGVPLADVALDAGFADQAHFTRVFRRETGSTPSEYRRRSGVRRDSLRLRAPR